MSDRFALPEDRREACRACDSTKREYLTTCARCETDICSSCMVEMCLSGHPYMELCDLCAKKYRNEAAQYGHQLEVEAA